MSGTNSMSNLSFRGLSRSYNVYTRTALVTGMSQIVKDLTVTNNNNVHNDVTIDGNLRVTASLLLQSRNVTGDAGFTVGRSPTKDMSNEDYRDEFDPYSYQNDFFYEMADFIPNNIEAGDKEESQRLIASYWNDLGNDVFDEWGYFFLYDVETGKYYFPLLSPQNLPNGEITTQDFVVFGRTFTIKHGWTALGIFKIDITVNDNKYFRFGAYGDMGSDGDEVTENLVVPYNVNGADLNLHYHKHQEDGDNNEILYSYFIPKLLEENETQTYRFNNDSDEMSLVSNEVRRGITVYFSKGNDVNEWVINDLELASGGMLLGGGAADTTASRFKVDGAGNTYVFGSFLSSGVNLGRMNLTTMGNADYYCTAAALKNGYFKTDELTENRNFVFPSAQSIVASIPDCGRNTTFRFIINNNYNGVEGNMYQRNLFSEEGSGVIIDSSVVNTFVYYQNITSYLVMVTNVNIESESVLILQESGSVFLP
jgi:hypothetical protein